MSGDQASAVFLAVETGGTKILGRLASATGEVLDEARWTTTTPKAACDVIVAFARGAAPAGSVLTGVGLAAFGPLVLDPGDPDCGRLLATTKPGWTHSNLRRELHARLGAPVRVDTDVNAAALAELKLGAGQGVPSLAYLTVGTGIGGGLATSAGVLQGAMHPEVGHLRLVRRPDDQLASVCRFHDDCAEGLAAGPALAARLSGEPMALRPEVQALTADYLAQLAVSLVLTWSPHRLVLGGGVGAAPGMLAAVRAAFGSALGGYGVGPAARESAFIVAPRLANAGLEGAMLMATTTRV
uniref:ROK family protein n=1 Tax=Caulobacter sp. (strain K31) TaxID=366602 RepID=B0T908_CAUSK